MEGEREGDGGREREEEEGRPIQRQSDIERVGPLPQLREMMSQCHSCVNTSHIAERK